LEQELTVFNLTAQEQEPYLWHKALINGNSISWQMIPKKNNARRCDHHRVLSSQTGS
jgi:hypothetical protein